ncbi:MAG: hypothetical protein E7066_10740 [Lentimicrobiaceae bacterium]|nr:hypothetical protein [Lentimicrobiaceae bacterium]
MEIRQLKYFVATAIPINCLNNKMEVCIHILKDTYRKESMTEFIEILNNSNAVMLRKQGW